MSNDKDSVAYQKNRMRHARGMYDQARHKAWQPEHERLNMDPTPVHEVSEDFRFRRPGAPPAVPVTGGHSSASRYTSGAPMRQIRLPRQPVNVTGMNHENAWMEGQSPHEFEPHMVPDPPPTPFTHEAGGRVAPPVHLSERHAARRQPEPQAQPEPPTQPIDQVLEGEYCVFVSGNLLFSTPSLDEAEDALNRLIFSDNPVPVEEVIVMRRLNLKIGASVG